MPTIQPQAKLLTVWRILLVLAAIPVAFVCSLALQPGQRGWLLLSALWMLLFLGCYLFYLPARLAGYSFGLEGDAVSLRKGVFTRRYSTLPLAGVQFTTIYAHPLARAFGLCSLSVVAPGARMVIPGLSPGDAETLARILSGRWEEPCP